MDEPTGLLAGLVEADGGWDNEPAFEDELELELELLPVGAEDEAVEEDAEEEEAGLLTTPGFFTVVPLPLPLFVLGFVPLAGPRLVFVFFESRIIVLPFSTLTTGFGLFVGISVAKEKALIPSKMTALNRLTKVFNLILLRIK